MLGGEVAPEEERRRRRTTSATAEWPLVGRAEELDRFAELLRTAPGLVLAGPAGVGKTRLALECLRVADRKGLPTAHATATHAASAFPLGALAPLLPSVGSGMVRVDDFGDLLRRSVGAFVSQAGERRLVLLVDDAHSLDDASATVVHQLASTEAVFVLVTVRTHERCPDPIVALWKDDLLDRLEVAALDSNVVDTLLATVLGGAVDRAAVSYLAAVSQGKAMFLREMVLGALEMGTLRNDGGLWRIVGHIAPSGRLVELVETRLKGLDAAERVLLELVSFGEPLGLAELSTVADVTPAEALERKGVLSSRKSGRRLEFALAHPLYGEVLRLQIPGARLRVIARLLAEAVETTGARRRDDVLRIGKWRLDGGGGSPELFLAAAGAARWRYDFPLAEQLTQAALSLGAGFSARLLAAHLLIRQSRFTEAEHQLSALAAEAVDDRQRALVAIEQIMSYGVLQGRADKALEIAERADSKISDQKRRDEIAARRATVLLATQGPRASAAAAEPLLDRTEGRALVWACIAAGYAYCRLGRFQRVNEVSSAGHAHQLELSEPLDWDPSAHVVFHCDALAYAGRFLEAEELAGDQYRQAVRDGTTDAQAFLAWSLGKTVAERGNITAAIQYLLEAVALTRDRPQIQEFFETPLALAFALAGQTDKAIATLGELEKLNLPLTLYMPADYYRARAWTAVSAGDLQGARVLLEEAARKSEEIGDLVGGAATLHDAARLGHPEDVVDRLDAVADRIEGDLATTRAAHARALVERDAPALEEVSVAFETMGAQLLAAEAAADAAVAWSKRGRHRQSAACENRADALAARCTGAVTPALQNVEGRTGLSRAERRVALLAANGRSNKEIAEHLVVSYRTIENQLSSVYKKLGITSRKEIADAMKQLGEQQLDS
jgi:DNA-binding CsgD family transcriptional regulator